MYTSSLLNLSRFFGTRHLNSGVFRSGPTKTSRASCLVKSVQDDRLPDDPLPPSASSRAETFSRRWISDWRRGLKTSYETGKRILCWEINAITIGGEAWKRQVANWVVIVLCFKNDLVKSGLVLYVGNACVEGGLRWTAGIVRTTSQSGPVNSQSMMAVMHGLALMMFYEWKSPGERGKSWVLEYQQKDQIMKEWRCAWLMLENKNIVSCWKQSLHTICREGWHWRKLTSNKQRWHAIWTKGGVEILFCLGLLTLTRIRCTIFSLCHVFE